MKRFACWLLIFVLLLPCVGTRVEAVTSGFCGTGVKWSLDESTGILTIFGTGAMEDYSLSEDAPWGKQRSNINKVIIKDGVTSIGAYAFFCYDKLTHVSIPASVTITGNHSFAHCYALTNVNFCTGVTRIEDYSFSYCYELKNVTIPESVDYIGEYAFIGCTALTCVTIYEGVIGIGSFAFSDCYMLSSVTIPASMVSIGNNAFSFCDELKAVYYACSSKEREQIKIGLGNDDLQNARWYYGIMPDVPSNPCIKATTDSTTGKPSLIWSAVSRADFYRIYRADSKTGSYTYQKSTRLTSYTDTTAVAGKNYYYKIKAVNDETEETSEWSNVVNRCCDLAKPEVTLTVKTATGKPVVKWNTIDGASKYRVYRSEKKTSGYSLVYTTSSGRSYTDTAAEAGINYYYKVKAIHTNSSADSAYSEVVNRVCDLAKPTISISYNSTSGKPVVKWETVSGAAKYRVYRSTSKDSGYELVYTGITARIYTDVTAVAGTNYYYKVKAIHTNSSADSTYSEVVNRVCDLAKPVISITRSSGDPKISWETVEGAEKYEIWRSTSKSGTYKKVKTAITARSYTDTSATAGKTYYYKVRAIHSNSSANSAYSSVKYITAK